MYICLSVQVCCLRVCTRVNLHEPYTLYLMCTVLHCKTCYSVPQVMRSAIEMGLRHTSANQLENIYHLMKMMWKEGGREEDILELCDYALRYYPTTAHLYFNRGKILLELERFQEAVSDLEIAVQTPVFLADINHALGLAHLKTGSTSKAEKAFRAELVGNPGNVESMEQLGILLQRSGSGGQSTLKEALSL